MVENATPSKMTRRERERLAHRREMLAAARRVFGRRGFDRATMDEIAQDAEFAKGTFYQYFEHKIDLFVAVVEEDFDELFRVIDEAMSKVTDIFDSLRAVVTAQLSYFETRRDFFRILMAHRPTGSPYELDKLRRTVLGKLDRLTDLIEGQVERGISSGVIKPYPARLLAVLLLGITSSYVYETLVGEVDYPVPEGAAIISDIFVNGARQLQSVSPEE